VCLCYIIVLCSLVADLYLILYESMFSIISPDLYLRHKISHCIHEQCIVCLFTFEEDPNRIII